MMKFSFKIIILMKMVLFSSFNFSWNLSVPTEVERREHYHFYCLQIQLRNVLTFSIILLMYVHDNTLLYSPMSFSLSLMPSDLSTPEEI